MPPLPSILPLGEPDTQALGASLEDGDLPEDATLCPGEAMSAQHLRQLLAVALPDKSRHKAAGWFGQTDFLLTRSHVDDEQDAYHDGLFITFWKQWDFWLALPHGGGPVHGNPLTQAWARLRQSAPAPVLDGLVRQYRAHDAAGQPGPWLPLTPQAPAAALQACAEAWRGVIAYWRQAEGQRRSGRPLRTRLHATLTPARLEALTLLPIFTGRYNDWSDPERNGWWEGEVWIGARQPGQREGRQWGRALKLSWRNGREAAGDAEDDAHACYQIELAANDAPPEGTAHPPGLRISYSQRQSDPRVPLPNDAVAHMARLLQLFTAMEQRLHAAHAREQQALQATATADDVNAPPLPAPLPCAPHTPDADVFGAAIMALSRDWQALGRAHAARVREHWARSCAAAEDPAQAATAAPLPADPRGPQASAVLQLAHAVQARGVADLSARFHRRFAFAPPVYAHRAARSGQAVDALHWQADGALLAHVAGAGPDGAGSWWQVSADGQHLAPAPALAPPAAPYPGAARTSVHGLTVQGDAQGDLHGLAEDGAALWRHHIGGAILAIAAAPDGHTLAVGSAGGYLVLLRKGSGTDPCLLSTSRYAELRRFIFWGDAPDPLAW